MPDPTTRIDYEGGYLTVERSHLGNVVVTDHYRAGEDEPVGAYEELTVAPEVLGRLSAALLAEHSGDARRAAARLPSDNLREWMGAWT